MNDLYANYPWVPFFQELSQSILKYRDNRSPLLAWMRRDLTNLKNRDNEKLWFCKKISDPTRNDIDPFSVLYILCKKYNYDTLEKILPIFKNFFQIQTDASSNIGGLITTNTYHFFFLNDSNIINILWIIYEKALSDNDFEKEYDFIQEKFSCSYLTYCLSWIRPDKYLGLNERVISFIRPFLVVATKISYCDYKQILKKVGQLLEKKTLACNSLVQLTEIAQRGHRIGSVWFIPGTPQTFIDGKMKLSKKVKEELKKEYNILNSANPYRDVVVLYGRDKNNDKSSLYLYGWGKFLPNKITMRSDIFSHIKWHPYGEVPINYENNRNEVIFEEGATTELLNLLRIETEVKMSNMETNYQKRINEFVALLEANKNLILTGAPGTGKTFMAREIAKALTLHSINLYGDMDNAEPLVVQQENRIIDQLSAITCKMVQFHPSYDYSDFVEGLRPIMKSENQLGFKRVNGVFKDFCAQSLESAIVKKKPDAKGKLTSNSLYHIYSDGYYEAVKSILDHDGYFAYFMDNYSTVFSVEEDGIISEDADREWAYSIKFEEEQWVDEITESFQLFEYLMRTPSTTNLISSQGLNIFRRGCPSQEEVEKAINNHAVSYNAIAWDDKIKNYDIAKIAKSYTALFAWVINYAKSHYEIQYLPTVFIIDEINRGEISKVFGELFYSIDPGYRGEKGRVQTQYQNMIDDNDVFKEGFFVPENVYIIGTMNDIDRSVESMDFAIRRRFAFAEVKAEDSYKNMIEESNDFTDDEKKEIEQRMKALNKAILNSELRLGEAYQIGAAYFRKYLYYKENGMEQAFEMLWNYHLKGLLLEYLRGNHNARTQLQKLKQVYDKKASMYEEGDTDNG